MAKPALMLAAMPLMLAASTDQLLPLKHGIFVTTDTPCKGASNVSIMSYWGGDNALNVSQAECRIDRVTHAGTRYTVTRTCTELQSGSSLGKDTVRLTIADPSSFTIDGTAYRWCGMKVQF